MTWKPLDRGVGDEDVEGEKGGGGSVKVVLFRESSEKEEEEGEEEKVWMDEDWEKNKLTSSPIACIVQYRTMPTII